MTVWTQAEVMKAMLGPSGMAAFVYLMFGSLFIALWRRDREPGMHWVGVSIVLLAVFYVTDAVGLHPLRSTFDRQPLWLTWLLCSAYALQAFGVARYVDPIHYLRGSATWLAVWPQVLLLGMSTLGIPIVRLWANVLLTTTLVVMALIVWRARKTEPDAGHDVLALSLMVLPLVALTIAFTGIEPVFLRQLSVPARMVFFVTLLVVSLQRRRKALEREVARRATAEAELARVNAGLEREVAARTADLRGMVAGLEAFNRNVSHDLRGPLGGIDVAAQLALLAIAQQRPDDAADWVRKISHQTRLSNDMLESLLELARVGSIDVKKAPVALSTLTAEVVSDLRQDGHGLDPQCVQVGALPEVLAHAGMLRIVLTNLLGNAVKFTRQQPGARISIDASETSEDVTVRISDNGPGFTQSSSAEIFEPFVRLHDRSVEGCGLGLSIVRRVIERHGGQVWALSREGGGAVFGFTLPKAGPVHAHMAAASSRSA